MKLKLHINDRRRAAARRASEARRRKTSNQPTAQLSRKVARRMFYGSPAAPAGYAGYELGAQLVKVLAQVIDGRR